MTDREFTTCIDACEACAQVCEDCANACLAGDSHPKMADCMRLNRDCAEICWTAAAFMSRGSIFSVKICRLVAEVCDACAAECERLTNDHCRRCARACMDCAEQCQEMIAANS
jgi:hypothetical protein